MVSSVFTTTHLCSIHSSPQSWGRPRDTGETLPVVPQWLCSSGPRLRAADHWGFLPLMHVYSHHVREDEWRENFIRMQISKSFWSGVKESEFWFCVSFSLQLRWMRRLWVYKNKVTLAVIDVLFCCAFFPFVNIMKLCSVFFKSYHRLKMFDWTSKICQVWLILVEKIKS